MPRVKVKRASTTIDMTAMCDVSFLLLTFFILTATARPPEVIQVDIPASATQVKLPEDDLGLVTVGGGGKVFFGVANRNVRSRMLELMSEKYTVPFTQEEKAAFSLMDDFGVPIRSLKQLIALDANARTAPGLQPGIPVDSTDAISNELYHWIHSARVATKELKNEDMRVSIKGDAEEKYPEVKKVMDVLQSQGVNKFSLITSLRGEDF